jgi:RecA/RadA recombinase
MSRKPKEEEKQDAVSSKSVLGSFLKEKKEDHYNFEEAVNYRVSTGSLNMDMQTGGGLGPGLHRFVGFTEGGKTSASLEVMKNFLNTVPNSKGFYIKAEGRLSDEMRIRSGVKFVFDADEWEAGTCFVFESNIYETVVDAMRKLIMYNEEKNKYMFIIDSVDGLIAKNDLDKTFEESTKVAGGAVIAANLMKKISIALTKRGHMAIFISQVRSDIKLDPYSSAPIRQTSATGGNALLHFANFIFEFEPRFEGDIILKDPAIKKADAVKNPIIGHYCKIYIKKSPNEKSKNRVSYPIKYGRKDGRSVWLEKEIVDMLMTWELVSRSGAWYYTSDELRELAKKSGTELPEKFQGENAVFQFIENDEKLTKTLHKYFVDMIVGKDEIQNT